MICPQKMLPTPHTGCPWAPRRVWPSRQFPCDVSDGFLHVAHKLILPYHPHLSHTEQHTHTPLLDNLRSSTPLGLSQGIPSNLNSSLKGILVDHVFFILSGGERLS